MTQLDAESTSSCGRMFLYVWSEQDKPNECKFGERFVKLGDDPYASVMQRVKDSLGVRKDLLTTSVVSLDHYWDVSTWATKVGRNAPQARMDDHVRQFVGFRKGATGEVHRLSSSDLIVKVNHLITQADQPLPSAQLSTMQAEVAEQVVCNYEQGHKVVLAELCARFGKTLWSGAIAHELQVDLVVVSSYVKTVFASFAKDLTSFEQWAHYVHVDTQQADWQSQVQNALAQGKQVVAYLSMANGSQRQARMDYLFGLDVTRLLIVDEADFGSHAPKQADALISAANPEDRVLIMTGTNADRASRAWKLDSVVSVTYPELLVQKRKSQAAIAQGYAQVQDCVGLAFFEKNMSRDVLMPGISLYQLDLTQPVAQSALRGELDPEMRLLPSWSKFAAHPQKSKGFFVRVLESVFLGKHGVDEVNVDLQTQNWFGRHKHKVAMMFMPHQTGITAGALKAIGTIAHSALPAWRVITLGGGDIRVSGKRVKNSNAERTVREQIEEATKLNQSVLIISSQLAQRSFSIPEITELYLAYDEGQAGSTIQKISRVLTPGSDPNKVGKIISLSFDPNRDDKFDALLLDAAMNISKRNPAKSAAEAMSEVLATVDIFKGSSHSSVEVRRDDYLGQLMSRRAINRVIGSVANLNVLPPHVIQELALGTANYSRATPTASVPKGKTKQAQIKPAKNTNVKDTQKALMAKARERLVAIADNIDLIMAGTGMTKVRDAVHMVDSDPDLIQQVEMEFGVSWATVRDRFDDGILPVAWLELNWEKEQAHAEETV
jgi:hypothetical protein